MVYVERCGGNSNTFNDPFDALFLQLKQKIIV